MEGTTAKFLQSVGDQRSKNEVLVDAWLRFSLTKGQDLALKDKENIGEFLFNEAVESHALIYLRLLTIYIDCCVIDEKEFSVTKVNSSRGFIPLSSHLVRYLSDLADGNEKIIWTMTEFAQGKLDHGINERERKATYQATIKSALTLLNILESKKLPIEQEWQFLTIKLQLISGHFEENDIKKKAMDLAKSCLESKGIILDLMLVKSLLVVIEIFDPKEESLTVLWSLFCKKLFGDEDTYWDSKNRTMDQADMIHILPSSFIKDDSAWRHKLDYVVKKPASYQEAVLVLANLQVSNASLELLGLMADFDRLRRASTHFR